MCEPQKLDGISVGDSVRFDPSIAGTGEKRMTGRVEQLREGVHGNYAKVIPDEGNYAFITKRTDRLEVVGNDAA